MIERVTIVLILAACSFAEGQAQNVYTPIAPLRLGDYFLNIPTTQALGLGAWEVRFAHRFSQPINDGDVHTFWGLDSSADIGIGLSYAPIRDLQLAVFRSDVQDDYELSAKYAIIRQAPAFPLSISGRAGADVRTEKEVEGDRVSPFAQVILSRQVNRKLEVFAAPVWVADAAPFDDAFNVPIGVAWMLQPQLSVIVEIVPENSDLPDDFESSFAWAAGLKRAIGGHYFELVLSNSRATHVDQYATSAFLGGLEAGDIHLGFNIERRFGGR